MQGSEYQSHAHPGHVPAPGQQPVYELETTAAAPRACHHNGFPNRDESGTLLKSPSIRSRQTPIPKNTLMNWRWTPANPVNLIFPKTPSYGIDSRPNDTTVTAVKTFSAILVTASCLGAGSFQSVAAAPTVQALAPAPGVVSSLTRVTVP